MPCCLSKASLILFCPVPLYSPILLAILATRLYEGQLVGGDVESLNVRCQTSVSLLGTIRAVASYVSYMHYYYDVKI